MPILIALAAGAAIGVYATSKGEDLVMTGLAIGGLYVAGKYVKAW